MNNNSSKQILLSVIGVAILVVAVISGFISIVVQLGDLIESKLKRSFNVKDFGNIFPGHGGVLDRIDSLLFKAPIAVPFADALTFNEVEIFWTTPFSKVIVFGFVVVLLFILIPQLKNAGMIFVDNIPEYQENIIELGKKIGLSSKQLEVLDLEDNKLVDELTGLVSKHWLTGTNSNKLHKVIPCAK